MASIDQQDSTEAIHSDFHAHCLGALRQLCSEEAPDERPHEEIVPPIPAVPTILDEALDM